jgi:hypothetical protein
MRDQVPDRAANHRCLDLADRLRRVQPLRANVDAVHDPGVRRSPRLVEKVEQERKREEQQCAADAVEDRRLPRDRQAIAAGDVSNADIPVFGSAIRLA